MNQQDEQNAVPRRTGFEDEYPFASRFLDFDGLRYHYVDEGQGEPLLLVHGNPTWSFAWRNIIKGLSPDYRVLAVDHVGCGFSDKPQQYPYVLSRHIDNLCRFVEQLDLQNVTLIAHDWGGPIGLGTAQRLRERFSRIVLMNTAAFRSKFIPLRIAVCRIPIIGPIAVRGLNLFVKAAFCMAVAKRERMTPAVKAGYLAPYDNWKHRVAVMRFVQDIPRRPADASYRALLKIEAGLDELRGLPMLLIWGERDWCFTVDFLREFEQRFPQAETFALPDAGHYVFEDAHEQIVPRLREFLRDESRVESQEPEGIDAAGSGSL